MIDDEDRKLIEATRPPPIAGPARISAMMRWSLRGAATAGVKMPVNATAQEWCDKVAGWWREFGFEGVTTGYVVDHGLVAPVYWVQWDDDGKRQQVASHDPELLDPSSFL